MSRSEQSMESAVSGQFLETMRATAIHEFGAPAVMKLEQVPTPHARPGEVVVRVGALECREPATTEREAESIPSPAR